MASILKDGHVITRRVPSLGSKNCGKKLKWPVIIFVWNNCFEYIHFLKTLSQWNNTNYSISNAYIPKLHFSIVLLNKLKWSLQKVELPLIILQYYTFRSSILYYSTQVLSNIFINLVRNYWTDFVSANYQGFIKGKNVNTFEIALYMLMDNMDSEFVKKYSKLSDNEINIIRTFLNIPDCQIEDLHLKLIIDEDDIIEICKKYNVNIENRQLKKRKINN
ncbi:hypothetical protein U3516DRAFT_869276 [Neocallimastix sp. 'constans']